jgi:hypothetical protein
MNVRFSASLPSMHHPISYANYAKPHKKANILCGNQDRQEANAK